MYLNHDQILEICEAGQMVDWDEKCVNAASLDVRLGHTVLMERGSDHNRPLDYRKRERMAMVEVEVPDDGLIVHPGMFFLAHTIEQCNFADDIAALFRIKSSMGRIGLEHMDAGWVDPGFHGSLTLEFCNMTQHHSIRLRVGDPIGQLVFLRGEKVSEDKSYRTRGNYNNHSGVAQIGYKG